MHIISRYNDPFKFECTGCGECCRSADHIFLSPYDLFNMSRASALAVRAACRKELAIGEPVGVVDVDHVTRHCSPVCV